MGNISDQKGSCDGDSVQKQAVNIQHCAVLHLCLSGKVFDMQLDSLTAQDPCTVSPC